MIVTSFLSLSLSLTPAPVPTATTASIAVQDEAADRIAAAGEDIEKLLALAATLKEEDNRNGMRSAYKRVLELDDMNEKAHKGLRHHFYDGKWFDSYAKLSKYRREEAKMMKEKYGKVRFNNEWVLEADVPFLRMGWVKEGETWANPHIAAKEKEVADFKEKGYQLRPEDSTWVAPEDFDKWKQGLYRCGDEWLTLEEANAYHAELGQWWELVGNHFDVYTTREWENGNWSRWYADLLFPELMAIFGVRPEQKPHVVVLDSLAQYNDFASGNQAAQRPSTEIEGFSSLHHAYFADIFFDGSVQPVLYRGCGVAYWDKDAPAWGPHSVRHATVQSYCEKIDPSWMTISEMLAAQDGGGGQVSPADFWEEKMIPRWLRYGAASYAERYADDAVLGVAENTNMRAWSLGELAKPLAAAAATGAGGEGGEGEGAEPTEAAAATTEAARTTPIRPLDDLFAFGLSLDDIEGSGRMIHEAGAVVAFIMKGGNGEVTGAHQAFKHALKKGERKAAREAASALEAAIKKNEDALLKFIGA